MKKLILIICLVLIPSVSATAKTGVAEAEISETLLSSLLSYAVKKVDGALSLSVKIAPKNLLLYKVSMKVEDFTFSGIGDGEAASNLRKLIFELRKSLLREGVGTINLSMAIPLKLHRSKSGQVLISGLMEYSTLNASVILRSKEDKAKEAKVNSLIKHLIKPLSMDRFAPLLLKNLENRYLENGLKVGDLLELKSKDIDQNKTLWISVNLGGINTLTPLIFTHFSTQKRQLNLKGAIE
ncbi:MAG: hypothetical protein KC646_17915 [Candidatus Cloacimonetes bacterium]|nr:hypothetical protein [Candidatus Cloacimonadota bacterium]